MRSSSASSRRSSFSPSFSNGSHYGNQSLKSVANVGVLWIRPDWIEERFTKVLVANDADTTWGTTASMMKTAADIVYQYLTESLRSELWYSLLHRHTAGADQVLVLSFGKYTIYVASDKPQEGGRSRRIMVLLDEKDASLEETLKQWKAKPQKKLQICLVDADDLEAEWPWTDSIFHHISSCASRQPKVKIKIAMNDSSLYFPSGAPRNECVALLSVPYYQQQPYNAYAVSNIALKQRSTVQTTSRKRIRFEKAFSDDNSDDDFPVDPPTTKRRRRHASLSQKFPVRRTSRTVATPKEEESNTYEEEDDQAGRNHTATQTDEDVLWGVDDNPPGSYDLDVRKLMAMEQNVETKYRAVFESAKNTNVVVHQLESDEQQTLTASKWNKESVVKETEGPTEKEIINLSATETDENEAEWPLLDESKKNTCGNGEYNNSTHKRLDQRAQEPPREPEKVFMGTVDASDKLVYPSTTNPITPANILPDLYNTPNDKQADAAPHMVSQEPDNVPTDGDSTSSDDSSSISGNETESRANRKLIGTVSTATVIHIASMAQCKDSGPIEQTPSVSQRHHSSVPMENRIETDITNSESTPKLVIDSTVQLPGIQQIAHGRGVTPVILKKAQAFDGESQLPLSVDGYASRNDHGQVDRTSASAASGGNTGTFKKLVANDKTSTSEQASVSEKREQTSLVEQQRSTSTVGSDTDVMLDKSKLNNSIAESPAKMQTSQPPLAAFLPNVSNSNPPTLKTDADTSDDDSSLSGSSSSSVSSSGSEEKERNTVTANIVERQDHVDQDAKWRGTVLNAPVVVSQNETGDFPVEDDERSSSSTGSSSSSSDSSSSSSSSSSSIDRQPTKIAPQDNTSSQSKPVTRSNGERTPLLAPDRKISFF